MLVVSSDRLASETGDEMGSEFEGGARIMFLVRHESEVPPADLSNEHDLSGVELRPLITETDGAEHFAMRIFRLQPGGYTPFHRHGWEHEVFVIEGAGQVVGEEEARPLEPGNAVYVPAGEKHRFQAGEKGLVFLCCIPHGS